MARGVSQVPDIRVAFDVFAGFEAITVKQLGLRGSGDQQERIAGQRVMHVVYLVATAGFDASEGPEGLIHAGKIPELEIIVVPTRDESATSRIERQSRHGARMIFQIDLVRDRQLVQIKLVVAVHIIILVVVVVVIIIIVIAAVNSFILSAH